MRSWGAAGRSVSAAANEVTRPGLITNTLPNPLDNTTNPTQSDVWNASIPDPYPNAVPKPAGTDSQIITHCSHSPYPTEYLPQCSVTRRRQKISIASNARSALKMGNSVATPRLLERSMAKSDDGSSDT